MGADVGFGPVTLTVGGVEATGDNERADISLWSRNGLKLDSKYPFIVQDLEDLKLKSAILDGEIVALDAEGIPRFGLLQRFQRDRSGTLMYLVFDLLYLNGEDLMDLPLVRRRELLNKPLPKEGSIRFSDAIEGRGIEFFRTKEKRGQSSNCDSENLSYSCGNFAVRFGTVLAD